MFFLTGICAKVVVKNRDGADTRRDAHPLGSVTFTHPGAASALFRYRRDVRHPSFGGGARLQRASTPPAVVRVERGRFALSASSPNLPSRSNSPISGYFLVRPHGHSRMTVPAISSGDTCAGVRVCFSQWGTTTTDYRNFRPTLCTRSRLRERPATWTVDCRWDRVEQGRAVLGGGFEILLGALLSRVSTATSIIVFVVRR